MAVIAKYFSFTETELLDMTPIRVERWFKKAELIMDMEADGKTI